MTPAAVAVAAAVSALAATSPPLLRDRLDSAVAQALRSEALRRAVVAIDVRSLGTGRSLYGHNAELSVVPASSLKLATTAAALTAYGPEARFRTTLQSTVRPDETGTLPGDLHLVGSGDPSLSRELAERPEFGVFDILVDALQAAGVRRVAGRVIGTDALFVGDRRGRDWSWEDLVWWYGAEVSALTFADGSANLKIIAGREPGAPLEIERHPASGYYQVASTALTCRRDDPPGIVLDRALGKNVITVSGCVPAGWAPLERFLAIEDPPLYAATVLAEAMKARGIEVLGGVGAGSVLPPGLLVLASYEGAPLAEILKDVNKPSHNLRAEMLLRLLGERAKGEGSAAAGSEAVLAFLKAQGVDVGGWELADGSGLSRTDLVTAEGMTELLAAMNKGPNAAAFRDSLPIAGLDGTLKGRFVHGRAEGRIQAKTGRLRHAYALAGYARPVHGEEVAFAIFVNGAIGPAGDVQDRIDAIATAIVGR